MDTREDDEENNRQTDLLAVETAYIAYNIPILALMCGQCPWLSPPGG